MGVNVFDSDITIEYHDKYRESNVDNPRLLPLIVIKEPPDVGAVVGLRATIVGGFMVIGDGRESCPLALTIIEADIPITDGIIAVICVFELNNTVA